MTPRRPTEAAAARFGWRWLAVAAVALGVGVLAVVLYLRFRGLTELSLSPGPRRIHGGDLLRAVRSVDVRDARVRFEPGHLRTTVSGHTVDVRPESDLAVNVKRLVLRLVLPGETGFEDQAGAAVELQEADVSTEGGLRVAVDGLPAVPLGEVRVTAAPGAGARLSADVLFARLLASALAGVLDAPLAESRGTSGDGRLRVRSATAKEADVTLRPGATLRLPDGHELTLGDPSRIRVRDLRYDAAGGGSWQATAELDLGCAPPTRFTVDRLTCDPGTGRLTATLDLALTGDRLAAKLAGEPPLPARLALAGGSLQNPSPAWQGDLKRAEVTVDSLSYSRSRGQRRADFSLSALANAAAHVRWESDGWRGSARLRVDRLKLSVPPGGESGTAGSARLVAAPDQPATLEDVALERDVGGGVLRLSLGTLTASGTLSKALSLTASLERFKASGGRVRYEGRDGTLVTADFAAGGSLTVSGRGAGGPGRGEFAVRGLAKAVEVTSPHKDRLQLQNVNLDVKSLPGDPAGVALACSGDVAVRSDRLAVAGAQLRINSLELRRGEANRLKGNIALTLSVPKSELRNAVASELARPITVRGGGVGKVLGFDCSVSDLRVDASGLDVSSNGPKLHAEGPLSVSGTLTTRRKIGVEIVGHHDFTLQARLSADAAAAFPPAAELAGQTVEIRFEYEQATVVLGGFLGELPFAEKAFHEALKVFGVEAKIKAALPRKVVRPLFKAGASDPASVLSKVRNPQVGVSDGGDMLVLTGTADLEF